MKTKICTKCGIKKSINEFYKSGKYYNSQCKQCKIKQNVDYAKGNKKIIDYQKQYRNNNKEKKREKDKEYRIKNENKLKEYRKKYYIKNKERIKEYREKNKNKIKEKQKEYYNKHNKEINKKHKIWLKNNREQQREYEKVRREKDHIFKLKKQIRNMIRQSFLRKGTKKEYKCEKILGCSIDYFITHLKQTYKNNYGCEWDEKEKVHIDHIIPLDSAKNEENIIKLCHYTNLQLLKEKDNIKKSNKVNFKVGGIYESK